MRYVIATHNRKKLLELQRILSPLGIEAVTGEEIGIPLTEAEETGTTFEENARIKAESACRETGLPAVADDSGLMVDALDGGPGVYSARFAGEGATDADRNQKLLRELAAVPAEKRTAKFVSAVCCVFPDGSRVEARGECRAGRLLAPVKSPPSFPIANTSRLFRAATESRRARFRGKFRPEILSSSGPDEIRFAH